MRLLMVPLLFSIAYLGFEHRNEIIDEYRAAYPSDPSKHALLDECAKQPNFNRLDALDRQACYLGTFGRPAAIGIAASASPYYAYSASHLPGSDIRRQEANQSYREIGIKPAAQTATFEVKPAAPAATVPAPAPPSTAAHKAAATAQSHRPVLQAHHPHTAAAGQLRQPQ